MTPKEIHLSTTTGGPHGDHHFVVLEIPASKKRNPNMNLLQVMDDLAAGLAHAHSAPAREEPSEARNLPDLGRSIRSQMTQFAQKYIELKKSEYEKKTVHASMNAQGCPVMWLHFDREESVPPMEHVNSQLRGFLKNDGIELRHNPRV